MAEKSAWSQVVSWPGEQDAVKWEVSRRSHVSWNVSFFGLLFCLQQMISIIATKAPECFPLVPKIKDIQLWRQERAKTQFFQMCLLPGKHSAVCLLNLSVCQMRFGPFGQSYSATPRPFVATAPTSGGHVPHIAIPLPPPSFFFFLRPLITNTCGLAVPPTAAKPPDCFSLWAQHCGTLGDLCSPLKRPSTLCYVFYWTVLSKQLSLEIMIKVNAERENVVMDAAFSSLSCLILHSHVIVLTGRKAVALC